MSTGDSPDITVLVVDDHAVVRDGIATALEHASGFRLVGEAADARSAVEAWHRLHPDVTLMDIQLAGGDGVEAITAIRAHAPKALFVVLTTYRGDAQATRALGAGARGYVLKSNLRHELLDAIRAVHAGRRYVSSEICGELAMHAGFDSLTPRELDVLRQCATGHGNKSIGAVLGISEESVKTHMRSILSKLGAMSRTHAVAIAIKRGIVVL